MEEQRKKRLREIPPVNEIICQPDIAGLRFPPYQVLKEVQTILTSLRERILASTDQEFLFKPLCLSVIANEARITLNRIFASSLTRVINATGVVLHTNCGRSVLPDPVLDFMVEIARGYSNLELNLASGDRGSRYSHVEALLCKLTGAEAAMVVNNNAAAMLLVIKGLAEGKEVVVSRGELVEVGGAFRIPEVLKAGGAALVEVGATNKTRAKDYAEAVNANTAILLKVHTSNYHIVGFTQEVSTAELVELGGSLGVPVVEDLGSGTLIDLAPWGIVGEPTVQEVVRAGVDLVTFSGDKLLGGPQAGIIVGKQRFIAPLKQNQLTRALRIDKLTLAALEGTLRLYFEERQGEIPTLAMLALPLEELSKRAASLAEQLERAVGNCAQVLVEQGFSQAGGGSLPTANLETRVVSVGPKTGSVNDLEEYLRRCIPPVLARIHKDKLLLDVRTLLPGDETLLTGSLGEWANQQK